MKCKLYFLAQTLLLTLGLQSSHLLAKTSNPEGLFTSQQLETIANSKQWKLLLGYRKSKESTITSENFFLSTQGKTAPLEELKKTLQAFYLPVEESAPNKHPICRYPGRYYWLKDQLGSDTLYFPEMNCPDFDNFSKRQSYNKDTTLSLIYATGYLGNPASYYGHLLVKINNEGIRQQGKELENIAINYGARIPDNENMILYIGKGLTGVYDSTFTPKEFYYHLHNYSDGELRDLWEYEIKLPERAHQLLTGHMWEMLGVTHKYYFTNRNCAYRVAELLELVSDNDLTNSKYLWVTPQSVVQNLSQAAHNGKQIVKNVHYHPSRQSKLYKKFTQLSAKERQVLRQIASSSSLESIEQSSLNNEETIRILDVLMNYYRAMNPKTPPLEIPAYQAALNYRLALPIGRPKFDITEVNQPHLGQKSSYTHISWSAPSTGSSSTQLRLRPAYYEQIDAGFGHIKGSTLTMMDTTISTTESEVDIEKIDFLLIENLYGFSTKLPGDNKSAWTIRAGMEKKEAACEKCLGFIGYAGKGYVKALFDDRLLLNTLAVAGAKAEHVTSDALFAGVSTGMTAYLSDTLRINAKVFYKDYLNIDDSEESYEMTARYRLSENLDLRASHYKNQSSTASIGFGFYW